MKILLREKIMTNLKIIEKLSSNNKRKTRNIPIKYNTKQNNDTNNTNKFY